jgi:hypothetical protein
MAKKKASSPTPDTPAAPPAAPPAARARRAPARRAASTGAAAADRGSTNAVSAHDTAADFADGSPGQAPSYEQIAEAAYHRFLQRGGRDGRDFDDWIEAEQELRRAHHRSER